MYLAALVSSISVAVVFAVVLIVLIPATRKRPHAREALWIAWHMLVTAIGSILILVVIGVFVLPMWVYLASMTALTVLLLWRRSRRQVTLHA